MDALGSPLELIQQAILLYLGAVAFFAAQAVLATGLKALTHPVHSLYRLSTRLQIVSIAMLRSLDILGCTMWLGPLYVIGLADRPTGRRMISSYIGFAAVNGHYWAIALEGMIDAGARLFGDRPGHCLRAYLHYREHDQ